MFDKLLDKPWKKVAAGTLILAIFVLMVHFGVDTSSVGFND